MDPEDSFQISREFTLLGKALQEIHASVDITEDLPTLGIKTGRYDIQEMVYYHFLKCFYNPVFGDQYSTLVNYDWYHPEFAHKYSIDELIEWFGDHDLEVTKTVTTSSQHFISGRRIGKT